jgi:hypothetical protein
MIALYKGTSLISKLIRWRTWSDYSHAAWIRDNGEVIEAWTDGVCKRSSIHVGHTPGTKIELFTVELTLTQKMNLECFLDRQIGKSYDWRGIGKFISRRDGNNQDRWFCSELVAAAFKHAGVPLLLRIPVYKIDPGMLSYSPLLQHTGTAIVMDPVPLVTKTLNRACQVVASERRLEPLQLLNQGVLS